MELLLLHTSLLCLLALLGLTATSPSQRVTSVTAGQAAALYCNLKFATNINSRYWKYSFSVGQPVSTCENETLQVLVTQWSREGVLVYSDSMPQTFESRVAITARFDLIIHNVTTLDGGCYECGQIYSDGEEQLDSPTLLTLVQPEERVATQQNEIDTPEHKPEIERNFTALWIFIGIAVSTITTALVCLLLFRSKSYMLLDTHNTGRNQQKERSGDESVPLCTKDMSKKISHHQTQVASVLTDLQLKHIYEWLPEQLKSSKDRGTSKRQILQIVHSYLHQCGKRQYNIVVSIDREEEIHAIQEQLQTFVESHVTEDYPSNDRLFTIFCAASMAGIDKLEDRKDLTLKLKLETEYPTEQPESDPVFVAENDQVSGSYRSMLLEYFFAHLLWSELNTREDEEVLVITESICRRMKVYVDYLRKMRHKDGDQKTVPPGRNMYEKVASSVADSGDLKALNTNFWTRLIARMHSDINKEILMYNILMTIIFPHPEEK